MAATNSLGTPLPSDPLQLNAYNALAPFVALASSATSPRAAADLIQRATSAPGTFFFAELFAQPNVKKLWTAEPEHHAYLSLLQVFCWGTWEEYERRRKADPSNMPELNEAQTLKLKQLTLMTLAHYPTKLTYENLSTSLALPPPSESSLELSQLVTSAIDQRLISAKLDPMNQVVKVSSVAPLRDLMPSQVSTMSKILMAWERNCGEVGWEVEAERARIKQEALVRRKEQRQRKKKMEEAMKKRKDEAESAFAAGMKMGRKRGSGEEDEGVDLDADTAMEGMSGTAGSGSGDAPSGGRGKAKRGGKSGGVPRR